MAEERQRWKEDQPSLDPARLVFSDETGTSTNMKRLRGRSPRGTRRIAAQISSRQEPCHDCDEMGGRSWNEAHLMRAALGRITRAPELRRPITRTGSQ